MKIYEQPTKYTVSALPEELGEYLWDLEVEYRGKGNWSVSHLGHCLGTDNSWEFEPQPSSRTGEWLATHRFNLETALALAREFAPKVWVNNYQAADVLAKHEKEIA